MLILIAIIELSKYVIPTDAIVPYIWLAAYYYIGLVIIYIAVKLFRSMRTIEPGYHYPLKGSDSPIVYLLKELPPKNLKNNHSVDIGSCKIHYGPKNEKN